MEKKNENSNDKFYLLLFCLIVESVEFYACGIATFVLRSIWIKLTIVVNFNFQLI